MVSALDGLIDRATAVPRGPVEWGSLLYQEPWAYTRRMPGKFDIFSITGIVFIGGVVLYIGLANALDINLILASIYFGVALLLLVGSADLVIKMRHTLPFRIYRKGVTLPGHERVRRYSEADHFVPFERVKAVAVKQDDWAGGPSTFVKFDVITELREVEERIASPRRGVEAAPIIEALRSIEPKLEIEEFLEPHPNA